jgi:hypothetical protein
MDAETRRLLKQTIDNHVRERIHLEAMELDSTAGWELAVRADSDAGNAEKEAPGGFLEGWLNWLDATTGNRARDDHMTGPAAPPSASFRLTA